jgi:hypothetical protein
MRRAVLAVALSLLFSLDALASPRKVPHRPSPKGVSPIAHFWAQIHAFLRGDRISGNSHDLPPPPSTVISGS